MSLIDKFWEDGYEGNNWNKYIIQAPTFFDAAKEAAKRNWWLHCWEWMEGKEIKIYINELYLTGEIQNDNYEQKLGGK
jgi:hypothetical protein